MGPILPRVPAARGRMFHTTFLSLSLSHKTIWKKKRERKLEVEELSNYHDGKSEKPHSLITKRIFISLRGVNTSVPIFVSAY